MASREKDDKAAAKARAREKAKARRAEERAQVTPTPEWIAEFREVFTRHLATLNIQADLARIEPIIAEIERRSFQERMKPGVAALEAFRSVRAILQGQQADTPAPGSIRFSIRDEGPTRFVTFTHFQVRVVTHPDGTMEYTLDGLEGCDMAAFNDILRLAQEARDGEYYLHGAAAYEWWVTSRGISPSYEQLSSTAKSLYKNEKFTVRFQR